MQTVARVIISDTRGTLAEQVDRRARAGARRCRARRRRAARAASRRAAAEVAAPRPASLSTASAASPRDGREYVITTTRRARDAGAVGQRARQPVVRHRRLRERRRLHLVRERARVPPDALVQRPGQRCRAARRSTCATRRPASSGRRRRCPRAAPAPYVTRHGFGYSVFEHTEDGIATELCVYVALDAPVKFSVLKLRNDSGRPRRLSATGYVEWVLGDLRAEDRDARRHRGRPDERRALRAQRLQHRVRRPRRVLRRQRRDAHA